MEKYGLLRLRYGLVRLHCVLAMVIIQINTDLLRKATVLLRCTTDRQGFARSPTVYQVATLNRTDLYGPLRFATIFSLYHVLGIYILHSCRNQYIRDLSLSSQ
jgi:hypothetical protein